MTATSTKHWLVAYDIRAPKRLARVHRFLRKIGIAVQYSVFGLELDDNGIRDMLGELEPLINPAEDDVRAYHLPDVCPVWTLGKQALPAGIELHATRVMRLLNRSADSLASARSIKLQTPSGSDCFHYINSAERADNPPRSTGD